MLQLSRRKMKVGDGLGSGRGHAILRLLTEFFVAGHDRGGRVVHRMALDHPEAVRRAALLDIAPTATMYTQTNRVFAIKYFWWFFQIQPAPLPEKLISAPTSLEGIISVDVLARKYKKD